MKKNSIIFLLVPICTFLCSCNMDSSEVPTPSEPLTASVMPASLEPSEDVKEEVFSPTPSTLPTASAISDSPEPTEDSEKEDFLPLEVKEYGYTMHGKYLYCAVALHNPNTSYCVKYPAFRVTARDSEGILLGSHDQTLSMIYPQQDFYYVNMMFEAEEEPASLEVKAITPSDYNIVDAIDFPEYKPLTAINTVVRGNRVMGEIKNDNDYEIKKAIVTVIFRDEGGNMISGHFTFIDHLPAGESTPFDMSVYEEFITPSFEIYANVWN